MIKSIMLFHFFPLPDCFLIQTLTIYFNRALRLHAAHQDRIFYIPAVI